MSKSTTPHSKLLHDYGVKLAIGTDSPPDTSWGEVEYLRSLKVFDDVTLLKMWTETTPQSMLVHSPVRQQILAPLVWCRAQQHY